MIKFNEFVGVVAGTDYKISGDKIQQTQRNDLKKKALDSLFETMLASGLEVSRNGDGVVIAINGTKEYIHLALDLVVKNLDYDLELANDEYNLRLEKQAEREAKRKELAEKRSKKE